MNKITTNSQLLTTEPKKTKTKQITRTGTESQIWRSSGRLTVGREKEENGGKDTGNKKRKWQVQNRQGDVKNSIGNEEAKEHICMILGHELSGEIAGGKGTTKGRGAKGEKLGQL